jgi:thiol-disulfide isomerase/thioredoxin
MALWNTRVRWLAAASLLAGSLALCADSASGLTLKDQAGRKVRLRDLRGRPVLLNFWATWCVPCNDEMPALVAIEKQYAGRVAFIGASLDDSKTESKIPAFLARYRIDFPIWLGATLDDLDRLKMGNAVPATAFLDQDGRIVARILGQARPEEVKERLDWLTGDRSGAPPEALVKHLEK